MLFCPSALPEYKPEKVQQAYPGQAYDFDFGYSSPAPPLSFSWTKNGLPFKGIGRRVVVSHEGVLFTRVLSGDAGYYVVKATNAAGSSTASALLKGETRQELPDVHLE